MSNKEPKAASASASESAAADEMVEVQMQTGLRGVRMTRELKIGGKTYRWEHDGSENAATVRMPRSVWEANQAALNDANSHTSPNGGHVYPFTFSVKEG